MAAGDAGHVAEAAGGQPQQGGVLLGAVGGERPSGVAAVRCGTWLTTATTWSWRSGDSATHLGAELRDHAGDRGERCVVGARRSGVSTHTAPLNIVAVGAVEPVELAAGHRVAADEAGVVARPRTSRAFTLPTSVTTPSVSASARFTWSATASTGTATNVISASRIEAGGVDDAAARSASLDSCRVEVVAGDVPAALGAGRARSNRRSGRGR